MGAANKKNRARSTKSKRARALPSAAGSPGSQAGGGVAPESIRDKIYDGLAAWPGLSKKAYMAWPPLGGSPLEDSLAELAASLSRTAAGLPDKAGDDSEPQPREAGDAHAGVREEIWSHATSLTADPEFGRILSGLAGGGVDVDLLRSGTAFAAAERLAGMLVGDAATPPAGGDQAAPAIEARLVDAIVRQCVAIALLTTQIALDVYELYRTLDSPCPERDTDRDLKDVVCELVQNEVSLLILASLPAWDDGDLDDLPEKIPADKIADLAVRILERLKNRDTKISDYTEGG